MATIVYVDRYDEKNDEWGQIDAWVAEDENTYYRDYEEKSVNMIFYDKNER